MTPVSKQNLGFTLIELMIVVAIIGILAAMAIPQFRKYGWKAQRSEATILLKQVMTAETSYFASYDHYVTAPVGVNVTSPGGSYPAQTLLQSIGIDSVLDTLDKTNSFEYYVTVYTPTTFFPGNLTGGLNRQGFAVTANKDLDGNFVVEDVLFIRSEFYQDLFYPSAPHGIPIVCQDDITQNINCI